MSVSPGVNVGGYPPLGEENGGLGGGVGREPGASGLQDGGLRRGVLLYAGQGGERAQTGPTAETRSY